MNIICKECGTENEKEYAYCKNCGAKLLNEQPKKEYTEQTQDYRAFNNSSNDEPYFNGVTSAELSLFIGKKSNEILPKFQKMALTDSKISWCWPAAILSFLMGPFGAALWFFYRKMYKFAFIFSGIGAGLSIILGILNFGQVDLTFDTVFEAIFSGNYESAMQILANLDTSEVGLSFLATALQNIVEIAITIVTGIFGYNIYMNHCTQKIKNYKLSHADPRFYQMGISAIGGVSGGMLALGFLIMFGTDAIISFVSAIFSLIT